MRPLAVVFYTSIMTTVICLFCAVMNSIIADCIGDISDLKKNPYCYYWVVLCLLFLGMAFICYVIDVIIKIKNHAKS
jgi:H+/Cl- antiporter ClcA